MLRKTGNIFDSIFLLRCFQVLVTLKWDFCHCVMWAWSQSVKGRNENATTLVSLYRPFWIFRQCSRKYKLVLFPHQCWTTSHFSLPKVRGNYLNHSMVNFENYLSATYIMILLFQNIYLTLFTSKLNKFCEFYFPLERTNCSSSIFSHCNHPVIATVNGLVAHVWQT